MRPVLQGDLTTAARALLRVPKAARPALARDILSRAHQADGYRKRYGRAHPHWGNGTVMAAAMTASLPAERQINDPAYLDCLVIFLRALQAHLCYTLQASPQGSLGPDAHQNAS